MYLFGWGAWVIVVMLMYEPGFCDRGTRCPDLLLGLEVVLIFASVIVLLLYGIGTQVEEECVQ